MNLVKNIYSNRAWFISVLCRNSHPTLKINAVVLFILLTIVSPISWRGLAASRFLIDTVLDTTSSRLILVVVYLLVHLSTRGLRLRIFLPFSCTVGMPEELGRNGFLKVLGGEDHNTVNRVVFALNTSDPAVHRDRIEGKTPRLSEAPQHQNRISQRRI